MGTWSGSPSPSSCPSPGPHAGNCVVLKPSEISKNTEKVLAEVLPRYLDQVSRGGWPPWAGRTEFQPHFCFLRLVWPRPSHRPSQPQFLS